MKIIKFDLEKKYVNDFLNLPKKIYTKKTNTEDKDTVKQLITNTHSLNKYFKLNEVVPFDWDIVYTFQPYTPKENIEEIIGFKSSSIKENNINEGMVHLLFVKGEKVVASILGYSTNLGYRLDFPSKVTFVENAQFKVSIIDNIVTLKYLDE